MSRPKRYPSATEVRLVSVQQIATALGWTYRGAERRLRRFSISPYQRSRIGEPVRYDAQVIEHLRGLYDQPRRPVGAESDWLSAYLGRN